MHESVGAVLHHNPLSTADGSAKPGGAHSFSSDTHGFLIAAKNKAEPKKSRAVTTELCRTPSYNSGAAFYLSGFVELLLQSRHRHDCYTAMLA